MVPDMDQQIERPDQPATGEQKNLNVEVSNEEYHRTDGRQLCGRDPFMGATIVFFFDSNKGENECRVGQVLGRFEIAFSGFGVKNVLVIQGAQQLRGRRSTADDDVQTVAAMMVFQFRLVVLRMLPCGVGTIIQRHIEMAVTAKTQRHMHSGRNHKDGAQQHDEHHAGRSAVAFVLENHLSKALSPVPCVR